MRRHEWGNARHEAELLKEFGCFDLIVGADVVYVEEALPLLLASVAALLRETSRVRSYICTSPQGAALAWKLLSFVLQ